MELVPILQSVVLLALANGSARSSSFCTISLSDTGCSASIAELIRVRTECLCLHVPSSKRDAAAYARR
jgi:hypothetical protein